MNKQPYRMTAWLLYLSGGPVTAFIVFAIITLLNKDGFVDVSDMTESLNYPPTMVMVFATICVLYWFFSYFLMSQLVYSNVRTEKERNRDLISMKSVNILSLRDTQLNAEEVKIKNLFIKACQRYKNNNIELRMVDNGSYQRNKYIWNYEPALYFPNVLKNEPYVLVIDRNTLLSVGALTVGSKIIDAVATTSTPIGTLREIARFSSPLIYLKSLASGLWGIFESVSNTADAVPRTKTYEVDMFGNRREVHNGGGIVIAVIILSMIFVLFYVGYLLAVAALLSLVPYMALWLWTGFWAKKNTLMYSEKCTYDAVNSETRSLYGDNLQYFLEENNERANSSSNNSATLLRNSSRHTVATSFISPMKLKVEDNSLVIKPSSKKRMFWYKTRLVIGRTVVLMAIFLLLMRFFSPVIMSGINHWLENVDWEALEVFLNTWF